MKNTPATLTNIDGTINKGTQENPCGAILIAALTGDLPVDQCSIAVENLMESIKDKKLANKVEKPLLAPLKQIPKLITDYENPNNDVAVCGKLTGFISTVDEKEKSGQLDETDADEFRETAEFIADSLGCYQNTL